MNHLIQHLVREHLPEIAAKSLYNCHVMGLHSILFVDAPEQRIRLFVATEEHELWRNTCKTLGSLAAHAHHCNITLHCIKGGFVNLEYQKTNNAGPYRPFAYRSGILNKKGSFQRCGGLDCVFDDARMLQAGDSLELPASLIHSVQATKGKVAAWFVYEGREDDAYESVSYSDQKLSDASFDGLYQPMSEAQVIYLLRLVDILANA